jgi:hypothetical protein
MQYTIDKVKRRRYKMMTPKKSDAVTKFLEQNAAKKEALYKRLLAALAGSDVDAYNADAAAFRKEADLAGAGSFALCFVKDGREVISL